eukprot:COSAG05_NODE_731_length_7667_cov_140.831792_2_plen_101_part_00
MRFYASVAELREALDQLRKLRASLLADYRHEWDRLVRESEDVTVVGEAIRLCARHQVRRWQLAFVSARCCAGFGACGCWAVWIHTGLDVTFALCGPFIDL